MHNNIMQNIILTGHNMNIMRLIHVRSTRQVVVVGDKA